MDDAGRGEREHEAVAGGSAVPVPGPTAAPRSDRSSLALVAFVVIAIGVLVAGIAVFVASGGADDELSSASIAPFVTGEAAAVATTTAPPTVVTTTPPTTEAVAPATTAPSTTPTTDPPTFSLPEPGAETWTVTSDFIPDMTLGLAATTGDIRVFDGVADGRRCVGVVGPGDAVTTWCGQESVATSFLADRGPEPVVIDLGADTGSVTIEPQTAGWTLGSNGCSAPIATILDGVDPGALPVTGIICRRNEAFIGIGSALFGPGIAPDGGGILATSGDGGGWTVLDFGTAIDCAGQPAGVERCALFGVEADLFEAVLPLPPVPVLGESSDDIVGVTDKTAEVESWIGDNTDPSEIEVIVVGQLVDPAAEVPAIARSAGALQSGRYRLLVVEIPQLDDSIATETWAIWIGSTKQTRGVTAFSWATCARGVTDDGLCV